MALKRINTNGGLIKWIILIIVAILILSYFGISIRGIVNSPTGQDNISYSTNIVVSTWDNYLKGPATYLWNQIFINLIWDPSIQSLENMKNGQPTNIQSNSPVFPAIPPSVEVK